MEQKSPSCQAKHESYYDLDMDALVRECARNTNVTMVWAWMLWLSYALLWLSYARETRTLL